MAQSNKQRNAEIVRLRSDGVTLEDISARLGVGAGVVKGVLYRAKIDLPDQRRAKPNPERDALIRRLHSEGKTTGEIGGALGFKKRYTLKLQTALGLKPNVPGAVDWSDDLIADIKADYDDGMNLEDISAKHGVWRSTITRKAKQLGWPMRGRRYTPPTGPRAPRKKSERPKSLVWQPLDGSEPQPLIGRPFGACAWPLDGEGEQLACCLPVEAEGKPYCAAHAAIAYVSVPKKRSVGPYTPRFQLAA